MLLVLTTLFAAYMICFGLQQMANQWRLHGNDSSDEVMAENASYREWVTKALEKGAGPAHAWTRQTERAPPLPENIEDGDDILTDPVEKTQYFSRYWKGTETETPKSTKK